MSKKVTKVPVREISDGIKVKGFYRLNLTEDRDGEEVIVGDSGWVQNQITNLGRLNYLVESLGAIGGSSQIAYMALGTGAVPAATATGLAGEVQVRASVTPATSGSSAVQFTATFASGASFVTAQQSIANIGLFAVSSAAGGQIFAGNTYNSSPCATNQNVNATYTICFS